MTSQQKRYLLDIMISLEQQMRMVGVEMMASGDSKLMLHGDELVDAACIMKTWIDGYSQTQWPKGEIST